MSVLQCIESLFILNLVNLKYLPEKSFKAVVEV